MCKNKGEAIVLRLYLCCFTGGADVFECKILVYIKALLIFALSI